MLKFMILKEYISFGLYVNFYLKVWRNLKKYNNKIKLLIFFCNWVCFKDGLVLSWIELFFIFKEFFGI